MPQYCLGCDKYINNNHFLQLFFHFAGIYDHSFDLPNDKQYKNPRRYLTILLPRQ